MAVEFEAREGDALFVFAEEIGALGVVGEEADGYDAVEDGDDALVGGVSTLSSRRAFGVIRASMKKIHGHPW